MIRIIYFFVSLLLWVSSMPGARAQQDPQFSMYMYNPVYYNPAAAGSEGGARLQITQRTQYLGYQPTVLDDGGAQSTQLVSVNMPLAKIKSGIGIYAFNDKLGSITNQSVQISYAYRLALKSGTLALGIQGGVFNKGYDYSQYRAVDPNDPNIPTGRISQIRPDISAGVYYNTTDYWVGVSIQHINQPRYSLVTDRSTDPLYRNAYFTAGYRLGVGYNIDVQPSILVQYDTEAGIQGATASFNLVGTYDNRIWAGLGYRLSDALIGTAGIHLLRNNALRVGYSLDIVAGGTQIKSPTSHEVSVAYSLPTPDVRKKPIIRTPRFRY